MTIDKAVLYLENMKWLKGYDNTIIDGRPISDIIDEIIDLLKAKEPAIEQVAADYGLTPDGVSFALEQYQEVICEITHGRMSKLSYYADDIIRMANDLQCERCAFDGMAEPYVLSITEVIDSEDEYWLESINGGNGYGDVCIDGNGDYAFYSAHVIRGVDIDAYGKTWRCWSIKPSEELLKNTPWKE